MTQRQILEEMKKLGPSECLTIVEEVLHMIHNDLQKREKPVISLKKKKSQLQRAAESLLSDYSVHDELTIFTSLDSEDFYAKR
ncbi:MAG: hypothetical protein V1872_04590 [bacterium]